MILFPQVLAVSLCIILIPGKTQIVPLGPCNKYVLLLQFQVKLKTIPIGAGSESMYYFNSR